MKTIRNRAGSRPRLSLRAGSRPRRSLRAAIHWALLAGTGSAVMAPMMSHADTASDANSLDEVVVTATRRQQNILDVPYSISAISGDALDASHVQTLADLSHMIAGLSFVDQGPTGRSFFVLRGINADSTSESPILGSAGTVPPVSTYIGETPLFLSLHIDDLDRVEVLRGPQGTLYGSGSLAGTIRLIPKQPDPSGFAANVEADAGNLAVGHQWNNSYDGMLNLPFNDVSAIRITAGREHYAGFINEPYVVKLGPPSTAVNSPVGVPVSRNPANPLFGPEVFSAVNDADVADVWQTRIAYLFKPNDNFSVLASYYHQDDKTQGVQAVSPYFQGGSVDYGAAGNPFVSPTYPVSFPTGGVVFPANGTYDANDGVLPASHRKADLGTVDLSIGLGFATLSSSTSYYRDQGTDVSDGSPFIAKTPSIYGFMPRVVDYEQDFDTQKGFVEELRLVSAAGPHALDYVVGFFLQHLQGDNGEEQWLPGQTFFGNLAGVPGADQAEGDVNYIVSNTTDFLDRALFGELTWHVTDAWQVTGGARFFKQDFESASYSALPYCGSYCGTGTLGVTNVNGGYSANSHTFKLDTSYKVNDAIMPYADFSEGFRRGGANAIPLAGPFEVSSALLVYKPDQTKNYELGAKGTLLGNMHYTADVFFIDWNNFQLDTSSYYGGYPLVANGHKARSKGVELSLDGRAGSHFSYTVGYTYTVAQVASNFAILDRLDDGTNNEAAIVSAQSGTPLPNAPKNSATLSLDYGHVVLPFSADYQMRYHLDGNYRSATYSRLLSTIPGAPAPFLISGFSIWNGSIDLMNTHGLSMSLYGQNLFNTLGITGGLDPGEAGPPPTNARAAHYYISRPRTIGLRVGYKF
jgi:outer membrane receptor protein involved in Fe transport